MRKRYDKEPSTDDLAALPDERSGDPAGEKARIAGLPRDRERYQTPMNAISESYARTLRK